MVMTLCSDVVIPAHRGAEVTPSGDSRSSSYPITRERCVVACPLYLFSVTTTLFLSIPEELAGGGQKGRKVIHLSCFFLPVTLEQFCLAVRNCPDREDQALLMKVGYQTKY